MFSKHSFFEESVIFYFQVDRGRSRETIGKLDQSISIVEKQLSENRKQVDKVMAAEIKSRFGSFKYFLILK